MRHNARPQLLPPIGEPNHHRVRRRLIRQFRRGLFLVDTEQQPEALDVPGEHFEPPGKFDLVGRYWGCYVRATGENGVKELGCGGQPSSTKVYCFAVDRIAGVLERIRWYIVGKRLREQWITAHERRRRGAGHGQRHRLVWVGVKTASIAIASTCAATRPMLNST